MLMESSGRTNPRSVLYCIARFADHERKKFVVEHLSRSGEIVSGAALMALAVLDPQEAIARIADVDDGQMLFRAEWLPLLLRADTELTRQRIRELADSDSRGHRLIENYFGKRPADLDRDTLALVLRTREKQLRDHFDLVTTQDVVWPLYPLRLLGRMRCPDLLRTLQEEAGGDLESAITALACSRLRDNDRTQDPVLEAARSTLVLFAGKGIVALVNRELESEHYWVRYGGLNGALMRGDEGTIQRLSAIARRPRPPDSGGESDSDAQLEFYDATMGLAALGADEILVEIFSNPEFANVPLRLADFRAHRGPMAKSLTESAARTMRCAESSEEALRCSLVIAWLSGDAGLIPDVRAVLSRVEPDSRNALHACIALDALGDQTADFARMAERLAATKENGRQGLAALTRLGRDGVDGLRRWLNRAGNAEGMEHREAVVRALYAHTESRKDAIAAAAESCLMNRVFFHPLYEIAAESEDQAVRERILEEAFSEDSIMVNAPLDAIRGLAKFDANRAVEAVELGLSNHPKIERELCLLLVRLAPESAAERLMDTAIALERDSLSDAVGRALRRLEPNAVAEVVARRLGGTDAERRVVCPSCGMVTGHERLRKLWNTSRIGRARWPFEGPQWTRFIGIARRKRLEDCLRSSKQNTVPHVAGLSLFLSWRRQIPTCSPIEMIHCGSVGFSRKMFHTLSHITRVEYSRSARGMSRRLRLAATARNTRLHRILSSSGRQSGGEARRAMSPRFARLGMSAEQIDQRRAECRNLPGGPLAHDAPQHLSHRSIVVDVFLHIRHHVPDVMAARTHPCPIVFTWRLSARGIGLRPVPPRGRRQRPLTVAAGGRAPVHGRPVLLDIGVRHPISALDQQCLTEFELDPLPSKLATRQDGLSLQSASTPQALNDQATVFRAGQRIRARLRRRPVQEIRIRVARRIFARRDPHQPPGFGSEHQWRPAHRPAGRPRRSRRESHRPSSRSCRCPYQARSPQCASPPPDEDSHQTRPTAATGVSIPLPRRPGSRSFNAFTMAS